ncbi:MAG: hypothetical protein HYZ28_01175 [Myxococcales bacterium]|nr:hypothetical protein [Myxococcales bacterium]
MAGTNRIDPTPVRISTNLTIDRQTPKTDFGDRVKAGLDTAAGAVANGAALAAPFVPGGAIVSAAVSSVTQMSNSPSSGQAASSAYAMSGVVNLPGAGTGGINTTVGGGNTGSVGQLPGVGTTVSGSPSQLPGTSGGGTVGQMNADLIQAQAENSKLIQVQMSMQRENQVFTTVSNVLKTRHDTVKNTISNVR